MTGNGRQRIIRTGLLLAVFITYLLFLNGTPHIHDLEKGTIAHIHPFSGQEHSHSQDDLDTICVLSFFIAETASETTVLPFFPASLPILYPSFYRQASAPVPGDLNLRGPLAGVRYI